MIVVLVQYVIVNFSTYCVLGSKSNGSFDPLLGNRISKEDEIPPRELDGSPGSK